MPDPRTSTTLAAEKRRAPAWFWVTIAIVTLLGGMLRVACSRNDLWLDEIWSLALSRQLPSAWAVFRAMDDNNHPLNTLFLYLAGAPDSALVCRSFSVFTGTISIMLAGLVARAHSRAAFGNGRDGANNLAGVASAYLLGIAYIFVLYSSEARGYAPLICFSLLALYALDRGQRSPSPGWIFVYWGSCVLALLSHAEAFEVVIAGLGFTLFDNRGAVPVRQRALKLGIWHAIPILAAAVYYLMFVRHLKVGGGPASGLFSTLAQLATFTFGAPSALSGVIGVVVLITVVTAGLLLLLRTRTSGLSVLYACGILGGIVIQFFRPKYVQLFPRYFLINGLFLVLLAALVIGQAWSRFPRLRIGLAALLVTAASVNGAWVFELLRFGRGEYGKALEFIGRNTSDSDVSIGSDHDFRHVGVLAFYARRLQPGQRLKYYPAGKADMKGPQWLILHRLDGAAPPPTDQPGPLGAQYTYVARFRHAPLSGWDWFLYRNIHLTDAPRDVP